MDPLVQPPPALPVLRRHPTGRDGGGLLRSQPETSRRLSSHHRGDSPETWHITSVDIDPASFPKLNSIFSRRFTHAVAFHGFEQNGILIGGGTASAALQAEIAAESQSSCGIRHLRQDRGPRRRLRRRKSMQHRQPPHRRRGQRRPTRAEPDSTNRALGRHRRRGRACLPPPIERHHRRGSIYRVNDDRRRLFWAPCSAPQLHAADRRRPGSALCQRIPELGGQSRSPCRRRESWSAQTSRSHRHGWCRPGEIRCAAVPLNPGAGPAWVQRSLARLPDRDGSTSEDAPPGIRTTTEGLSGRYLC
jgi:hypothetical protein